MSGQGSSALNDINHRDRKRASSPMFGAKDLPPELAHDIVPLASSNLRNQRWGPLVVQYGCYAGASAVAWTYLSGFVHLANKNREAWSQTFRHRIIILAPILSFYAAGNGVIPMPFRHRIEEALGVKALSTMDLAKEHDAKLKAAIIEQAEKKESKS